jgi:hypothetical protein
MNVQLGVIGPSIVQVPEISAAQAQQEPAEENKDKARKNRWSAIASSLVGRHVCARYFEIEPRPGNSDSVWSAVSPATAAAAMPTVYFTSMVIV